jgi:hypothetical protein
VQSRLSVTKFATLVFGIKAKLKTPCPLALT